MAVYRDPSVSINEINKQANANAMVSGGVYRSQAQDLSLQNIETQKAQTRNEENYGIVKNVFDIINVGLEFGSWSASMIEQSQKQSAEQNLKLISQEGQTIINQSIQSGESYWEQDENGNSRLVMGESVRKWQEETRQKIRDSKYMGSVKGDMLSAFEANNRALEISAYDTAMKQSYAELQSAFASNLETSVMQDVQTYISYGGDLEAMVSDGVLLSGTQTIASQKMLTPQQKKYYTAQYFDTLRTQGDIEIASQIARTQGAQAAHDYIYSDSRSYLTEQQKQSAYSTALKSLSQSMTLASDQAASYMQDALMRAADGETGMTARVAYQEIAKGLVGAPKEVQKAAMDSAKAEQIDFLNEVMTSMHNEDLVGGLASLRQTYEALQDGTYDDYFVNCESLKSTALAKYKTSIDKIEKELATQLNTSVDKIRSANSSVVTEYEKYQKNIWNQFENGTLTGEEAILLTSMASATYGARISAGENPTEETLTNATLSASIIQTTANTQINKLIDDYVPADVKAYAKSRLSSIMDRIGMPVSESARSDEQKQQMLDLEASYYGQIADYIFRNGQGMTSDSINSFVDDLANRFALEISENGNYWKIVNGTAFDSAADTSSAAKSKKQYEEVISTAYKSGGLIYDDKAKGTYAYISNDAKEMFDDLVMYTATQVSYITGEAPNKIAAGATPTLYDGNRVYVPQVYSDNRLWRLGPNGTFECYDGVASGWQNTGIAPQTTEEKMQGKIAKSPAKDSLIRNEEDISTSAVSDRSVSAADQRWAEAHPSAFRELSESPASSPSAAKAQTTTAAAKTGREEMIKAIREADTERKLHALELIVSSNYNSDPELMKGIKLRRLKLQEEGS